MDLARGIQRGGCQRSADREKVETKVRIHSFLLLAWTDSIFPATLTDKTAGFDQNHRSGRGRKTKGGEKWTAKGQEVVDLGDRSVLDGQDMQGHPAVDAGSVHL